MEQPQLVLKVRPVSQRLMLLPSWAPETLDISQLSSWRVPREA